MESLSRRMNKTQCLKHASNIQGGIDDKNLVKMMSLVNEPRRWQLIFKDCGSTNRKEQSQ